MTTPTDPAASYHSQYDFNRALLALLGFSDAEIDNIASYTISGDGDDVIVELEWVPRFNVDNDFASMRGKFRLVPVEEPPNIEPAEPHR
jgi:hypothetical protein